MLLPQSVSSFCQQDIAGVGFAPIKSDQGGKSIFLQPLLLGWRGGTVKRCCCSSPCPGGCCGADEHPAWHPRSLGNASVLPRLLGRLGKAFPLATQNKVGSVLELRASPGWGGRGGGASPQSTCPGKEAKNAAGTCWVPPLLPCVGGPSPQHCSPSRAGTGCLSQGARVGQEGTGAHHCRGDDSGEQGRLKWAPPPCRGE